MRKPDERFIRDGGVDINIIFLVSTDFMRLWDITCRNTDPIGFLVLLSWKMREQDL